MTKLTQRKKILIGGGGHADIPLITAAKELGFFVITTGNQPDQLGHSHADLYCPADFSSYNEILNLAQRMKVSGICACCNDFSALSAAYASEQLGLPGHDPLEIAELIHHKDQFRSFSTENEFPVPRAANAHSIEQALSSVEHLEFPLIVKPVDMTGGKGVTKVNNKDELRSATEYAFNTSRNKRIVIEEFIEGTRHAFSAFIVGKKVVFYFVDNEQYYLNPYLVSAAYSPSSVDETCCDDLKEHCERYATLLNLCDGIMHVQFILKNGKPSIIEICRRAPGDLYIELVRHATGNPFAKWIVQNAAGIPPTIPHQVSSPTGRVVRHCIMADKEGILQQIIFSPEIRENIIDKLIWAAPGAAVKDALTSKFGIVFLKFDSEAEMSRKIDRLNTLIKPVIVPASHYMESDK